MVVVKERAEAVCEPPLEEIKKTDRLSFTPKESEARAQLRPSGCESKEIGDCASPDVAEEAHGTPNAVCFDAATIAEGEERVIVLKNVVGNKVYAAVRDRPDVQHKRILDVLRVVIVIVIVIVVVVVP